MKAGQPILAPEEKLAFGVGKLGIGVENIAAQAIPYIVTLDRNRLYVRVEGGYSLACADPRVSAFILQDSLDIAAGQAIPFKVMWLFRILRGESISGSS
jgi:hypothetical protein